jgi:translation initiation factor 2 beta subunit (eIF-2beta)/eIF-5
MIDTAEYKQGLEEALFIKITNMIESYTKYNNRSPVKEVSVNDIIFEDDFQKELELNIKEHKNAKIILIKKLIQANLGNR